VEEVVLSFKVRAVTDERAREEEFLDPLEDARVEMIDLKGGFTKRGDELLEPKCTEAGEGKGLSAEGAIW
jgi:hypothetical protein